MADQSSAAPARTETISLAVSDSRSSTIKRTPVRTTTRTTRTRSNSATPRHNVKALPAPAVIATNISNQSATTTTIMAELPPPPPQWHIGSPSGSSSTVPAMAPIAMASFTEITQAVLMTGSETVRINSADPATVSLRKQNRLLAFAIDAAIYGVILSLLMGSLFFALKNRRRKPAPINSSNDFFRSQFQWKS